MFQRNNACQKLLLYFTTNGYSPRGPLGHLRKGKWPTSLNSSLKKKKNRWRFIIILKVGVPFPKIVIHLPWTYANLHCKGKLCPFSCSEIFSYRQIYILLLYWFLNADFWNKSYCCNTYRLKINFKFFSQKIGGYWTRRQKKKTFYIS